MAEVSGAELARGFHRDVVGPLLDRGMPGLRYTAGRLGSGSDVLGFDDEMSRDHDWGCRLTLLVDSGDEAKISGIRDLLERELPHSYAGMPIRFPTSWDSTTTHNVEVATGTRFATSRLGLRPRKDLPALQWLSLPGQSILEVTAGPLFRDDTTEISQIRSWLRWYPRDVELYVLASAWKRVGQQLPFVGRTAERGQELQSRLLSMRLAEDLMRIAFLLHRRWSPYAKWFEKAFQELTSAAELAKPLLLAAASDWHTRERGLAAAAHCLLRMQRERGFATPTVGITPFWDRPYLAIDPAVPAELLGDITDPVVASLPLGIGPVDQWIDNTDVLAHPERRKALLAAYQEWATGTSA